MLHVGHRTFGQRGLEGGIALALSAACVYSLYIIISSRVVGTRTAMAGSAFIILSASVSYLCIALSEGVSLPESALGVTATLAIAFFSTVVAFWSFFAGLGRIGAAKASLVSTLEPLVIVISAVLFQSWPAVFVSCIVGDLSPAFKGCRQHAAIPDSSR